MNKKQQQRYVHFSQTVWLICLVFVSIGSILPGTAQIMPIIGPDKLLHLIAYAGLAFLHPLFLKEKRSIFRHALLLLLWSILLEGVQGLIPNRSPSFWDCMANTMGVTLGTYAGLWTRKRLYRLQSP